MAGSADCVDPGQTPTDHATIGGSQLPYIGDPIPAWDQPRNPQPWNPAPVNPNYPNTYGWPNAYGGNLSPLPWVCPEIRAKLAEYVGSDERVSVFVIGSEYRYEGTIVALNASTVELENFPDPGGPHCVSHLIRLDQITSVMTNVSSDE